MEKVRFAAFSRFFVTFAAEETLSDDTNMRELKITSRFTNRVSKGLGVYLNEISRERMISPEEEAELGRKLHGKGAEAERAKERLVRANLRFVVSVAKQYQGRSLSLEDLINEGNIGLVKAVNHFDETRGFKFISYAVWWIRQSIIEAIGVKSRAVRVPLSAAGTASRIQRVTAGYLQEFGWSPSREELSDLTGLPLDVIDHGLHAITHTTSIDQPVADGSTVSVSETIISDTDESPDREVDRATMSATLRDTLSACLDEREARIVAESFGIGCEQRSLEEIGADINLSRERVRQLREKAIKKLRETKSVGYLATFLG